MGSAAYVGVSVHLKWTWLAQHNSHSGYRMMKMLLYPVFLTDINRVLSLINSD